MSDDLTERLREIISAAKSRPKRSASGISGQTIEAMLRSVICQITEYELEFICEAADTIDAVRARVAELEAALEIIAGRRQCMDNMMGNRDVAIWVLDRGIKTDE